MNKSKMKKIALERSVRIGRLMLEKDDVIYIPMTEDANVEIGYQGDIFNIFDSEGNNVNTKAGNLRNIKNQIFDFLRKEGLLTRTASEYNEESMDVTLEDKGEDLLINVHTDDGKDNRGILVTGENKLKFDRKFGSKVAGYFDMLAKKFESTNNKSIKEDIATGFGIEFFIDQQGNLMVQVADKDPVPYDNFISMPAGRKIIDMFQTEVGVVDDTQMKTVITKNFAKKQDPYDVVSRGGKISQINKEGVKMKEEKLWFYNPPGGAPVSEFPVENEDDTNNMNREIDLEESQKIALKDKFLKEAFKKGLK